MSDANQAQQQPEMQMELDPASYIAALESRVSQLFQENIQQQAAISQLMREKAQALNQVTLLTQQRSGSPSETPSSDDSKQNGERGDQKAPDEDDERVPFSQSLDPSLRA